MKNTLRFSILVFLVMAGSALSAQETFTDKGIFLVRGTGSLNFGFAEGNPTSLQAGAGYFIMNNLVVGADLGYESVSGEGTFTFRPFGRYYFRQRFFGELALLPGSSEPDIDTALEAGIGYVVRLNDYITLEPGLYLPFRDNTSASLRVFLSLYF